MRIIEGKYDKKIVLALGLFDSLHKGHSLLIKNAKELASDVDAELAVFTFKNNPFKFYGIERGTVYTFSERLPIMEDMGVDVVIGKTMDENYAHTSKEDFLSEIFSNYYIEAIVCGADYTFGYMGKGNVEFLKEYAEKKGVLVKVVPYLCTDDGHKISSNYIRKLLEDGKIHLANQLLGRPYKISGEVVHCYARGREFGFPTANLYVPEEKSKLYEGVYATTLEVDGFQYDALTSIGIKPTFHDYTVTVESYIINFSGDIYGKYIDVFFYDKIRDIRAFNSEDEIRAQIEKDVAVASLIKRTL